MWLATLRKSFCHTFLQKFDHHGVKAFEFFLFQAEKVAERGTVSNSNGSKKENQPEEIQLPLGQEPTPSPKGTPKRKGLAQIFYLVYFCSSSVAAAFSFHSYHYHHHHHHECPN